MEPRVAITDAVPYVYGGSQDPYNGGIFEFDRATGTITNHFSPSGEYKTVWELAVTPNGHVMYAADPTYSLSNYQVGLIGVSSLTVGDVPVARAAATQVAGSSPLSVQFDGSASTPYLPSETLTQYAWNFGDGSAGSGVTPGPHVLDAGHLHRNAHRHVQQRADRRRHGDRNRDSAGRFGRRTSRRVHRR